MKYLFWNTHNNIDINQILCDMIVENNISVALLAEYVADPKDLIIQLSLKAVPMQQCLTAGCERITILCRRGLNMEPGQQWDHASIQIVENNIILCCVHLNSRIFSGHEAKREIYIEQIVREILKLEETQSKRNTVIAGDFNINPYESSCVNARYFHGIPVYEESRRESRDVAGQEYYMFYNPMWNFLGDFHEPYGTYYCNTGDAVNPYWNIYDQVLIRPALRKRFADEGLRVLTGTERISLLDVNRHPDRRISDHLPIMFEIKEE